MRIMKVILAVRGQTDKIEIDSNPHGISVSGEVCRVVVPMFDHWTNTENYRFQGFVVSSEVIGDHLLIEFPDDSARGPFRNWLTVAFAKATEGYRTMGP